jgi:hypothetical protein
MDGVERPGDLLGMLHRAVIPEFEFRDAPGSHPRLEVMADERRCGAQSRERFASLVLTAQDADEDARLTQVLGDLDLGHAEEADPWVVDFPSDDVAELLAKKLGNL